RLFFHATLVGPHEIPRTLGFHEIRVNAFGLVTRVISYASPLRNHREGRQFIYERDVMRRPGIEHVSSSVALHGIDIDHLQAHGTLLAVNLGTMPSVHCQKVGRSANYPLVLRERHDTPPPIYAHTPLAAVG